MITARETNVVSATLVAGKYMTLQHCHRPPKERRKLLPRDMSGTKTTPPVEKNGGGVIAEKRLEGNMGARGTNQQHINKVLTKAIARG